LHRQIKGQTGDQNVANDETNNGISKKVLPVGYIGPRKS
jgi:hypothetical protein